MIPIIAAVGGVVVIVIIVILFCVFGRRSETGKVTSGNEPVNDQSAKPVVSNDTLVGGS